MGSLARFLSTIYLNEIKLPCFADFSRLPIKFKTKKLNILNIFIWGIKPLQKEAVGIPLYQEIDSRCETDLFDDIPGMKMSSSSWHMLFHQLYPGTVLLRRNPTEILSRFNKKKHGKTVPG